jgi:apolipoprotein N-acyltransferase
MRSILAGAVKIRRAVAAGALSEFNVNGWRKTLRLWPWLAAVASGLLATGCFAPFDQVWLCWIALTPLIAAIWFSGENSRRRWLRNLLLGYVAGIAFFAGTFSWLSTLGTLFGNFALHGLPLLLAVYLGLYFAFWGWFAGLIRPVEAAVSAANDTEPPNKWDEMLARAGKPADTAPSSPWLSSIANLRLAFCLASAWVVQEWTRGWLSDFGWNGLGVALHANWPVIQIAEFTGVAGLSFIIAFANVIAVTTTRRLILEARTHRMRPHYDLTLTMAAIVGLMAFGFHVAQSKPSTQSLRVAAVQPNIAQREKFDPQSTPKIFDQYAHLSEIALRTSPAPELLIWPEGSMPYPVRDENGESYQFVMNFMASAKTDLLLGTDDMEAGRVFNAALFVSGADQRMQIYHKSRLVPFGEYIPLRHSFPLFAAVANRWVPGDFDAGQDYAVFELNRADVRIAPLICFEDTIGELTRQFVLKGANVLINITNDGWFLHSAGSQQHLANAIFRCVEMRRPMVRAANTGVTCFVNQFGHVTQVLQDETGSTFTEGVLTGDVDVPVKPQRTFYVRHGELFAKLCAFVTLLATLVSLFVIRRGSVQSA